MMGCPSKLKAAWRSRGAGGRVAWSRKTRSGALHLEGVKGQGQLILSLLLLPGGLAYLSFLLAPGTHLNWDDGDILKACSLPFSCLPTSFGKLGSTSCGLTSVLPAAPEAELILLLKVG